MTKLLIVDDHKMFLDGLTSILTKTNEFEIFGAVNATKALELLKTQAFHLAILDIEMPESDFNGVDLTKYIAKNHSETKVLIVSMNKSAVAVGELITAGANGYIIKDSGHEILLQAIHVIREGGEYWDPKILQLLIDAKRSQDGSPQQTPTETTEVVLTNREKDVLAQLALGLSSKEIANQLNIGTSTVDTHRKNLIAKFGAKNSTDVVMKAKDIGLL